MLPLALALTLLAAPQQAPLNASGGPLHPEQAKFDVLHYGLALEVFPARKELHGTLAMRARADQELGRVLLDLDHRLGVKAVRVNGSAAATEREADRLWIELAQPIPASTEFEVEVDYGGKPREAPRPPWDGGLTWSHSKSGAPWIATSCQGEGADLWWPCKDHPSDKPESMDLSITVPAGLVCASNGVLQRTTEHEDGRRTFDWHVSAPIANYTVALNIGPYVVIEDEFESVGGETVPAFFYALPESAAKAKAVLPEFLQHIAFYEDVCGPFPWRAEKYGVVETPFLGMEHQSIIAYGNQFARDPFGYDSLHHHELGHEWWANLVTCRDWKDMWLHEGFATYMQSLYVERTRGAEAYRKIMAGQRRGLRNKRAVAPRESKTTKEIYFDAQGRFDNDIYDKGSWILHTLRWVLGDEAFFAAIRRMAYPDPALEKVADGSETRFVDTEDFRAIAEAAAGADLAWFFEVYLRQPALPRLVTEVRDDTLHLRWESPLEDPFSMPVPVRVGERLVRVAMEGGVGEIDLGGAAFEVDPDRWLLRAK